MTERHKRSVKQYELKARNICIHMQQERGADIRIIEFFEDRIKHYEFRYGITPGLLDASLVAEN